MNLPNQLLKDFFEINPIEIKKMDGYESWNYMVKTETKKFVLKIYTSGESLNLLKAIDEVLGKLSDQFPKTIPSKNGDKIISFEHEGKKMNAQLLTFLEGTFLGEVKSDDRLLSSFGTFIGKMNATLLSHRSEAIEARSHNWDSQHALMNLHLIKFITIHSRRRIVEYFFQQFKEIVQPKQYQLRKCIIQSDANEWNVLTQNNEVSGLIDFGDICYSYLINDLSIAISYAIFGKKNPIQAACQIIKSYHEQLPLEEIELEILYYLIAIRSCISVSNSTYDYTQNSDNQYIIISQKPAWELLEKWIAINPFYAEDEFRKACGFPSKLKSSSEKILQQRAHVMSKSLSVSYRKPIQFEKAALQYMYSADGKTYLDAYNNIKHVGHCHPKIVAAIQQQSSKLNTNTRYIYESLTDYAKALLEFFPKKLNKVFFVNSGSAATDGALRMAQVFTKKKDMLVMEEGYHGNTQAGIEVSHYKFSHSGGSGEAPHIHTLPFPKKDAKNESSNMSNWKNNIQIKIAEAKKNGLAGFIAEPILGCAGQMPLPDGYLKMAYELVRGEGGVCIADEVQIGFGRTGKFWGYEHHEVIPDIVILGKPIGNGHPMGAIVTTAEIAASFDNGMEFFSSFGGNPISCMIGKAVLEVIQEEELVENAIEVGNYFKNELLKLKDKFLIIYDVRGDGFFLGVEFRKENEVESITPFIKEELKKRFILTSTDGPGERTLKIKPPMVFNKNNVDEFIEKLEEILISIVN